MAGDILNTFKPSNVKFLMSFIQTNFVASFKTINDIPTEQQTSWASNQLAWLDLAVYEDYNILRSTIENTYLLYIK